MNWPQKKIDTKKKAAIKGYIPVTTVDVLKKPSSDSFFVFLASLSNFLFHSNPATPALHKRFHPCPEGSGTNKEANYLHPLVPDSGSSEENGEIVGQVPASNCST